MNKKLFVNLITLKIKFDNDFDRYRDLLLVENPLCESFDKIFELVINDSLTKEQSDWVNWWLYDYQQGCTVTDENGNIINLDTVEKLWNFIQ